MLCLHNVLFPVQLAVLRPLGCAALRFPLKIRLSCSLTKAQSPPSSKEPSEMLFLQLYRSSTSVPARNATLPSPHRSPTALQSGNDSLAPKIRYGHNRKSTAAKAHS